MMSLDAALAQACRFSQYLNRHIGNGQLDQAQLLAWLAAPLDLSRLNGFADWAAIQAAQDEAELARQLRHLRRYVMATIIVRDTARLADLAEVTASITLLADFAIVQALAFAHRYYADLYGEPIGAYSGQPQQMTVVAMGKMGGYELNVSSDIDLIFVYPEAGDTDGARSKSNQEFFTKVGQKLIALLNDSTADGQVFRVDMRLRPNGDSGALVLSETALEQYLITQGREWERYAWIKGRVVSAGANDIDNLVRPFVYRKYLDFNAYEAMRDLHRQIRQEVTKKGMADNVKLGAGGIREVEFIAQIFQLIRGGQVRQLQRKDTQGTLQLLAQLQMLEPATVQMLLAAYRFLRDTEHRLQYWDDQQTQMLPTQPEQQQMLAESMGFADYAAFSGSLNQHRQAVNAVFNQILAQPKHSDQADAAHPLAALWQDSVDEEVKAQQLGTLGFVPEAILQRLRDLKQGSRYRQLSNQAQVRLDALMPQIIQAAATTEHPNQTLNRLLDFIDTVSRRSSYLALLHEHPDALNTLAEVMGSSSWMAEYLTRHPILLDELLSAQLMDTSHDWPLLRQNLQQSLAACGRDVEAQMDSLRHFQHAQVFRLAVQDLGGLWTVEALSDELSALADCVVAVAMQQLWASLPKTHTDVPKLAVIGYGKLGGKELGYASDLDLVFVYDDSHPDAADQYTRFVRRLTTWLSATTPAGGLYPVDLRLRPDGDAGFAVSTVAAFGRYQAEKAWTWEHQALTRARFVCGDAAIGAAFEAIRHDILTRPRDLTELRRDIIDMREKMFATHPPHEDDVKYARGGVVDVEFIVQYLILAHSGQHPQLMHNYGNIALLNMAAEAGLIPTEMAEPVRQAYRYFRAVQHQTKLKDAPRAQVDEVLLGHYQAVKPLWCAVLGQKI